MKMTPRILVLGILLLSLSGLAAGTAQGATISASSCSLQDVQAAVNAAADGDIVSIPNGSCSWSGGMSTNKQIIIRAQNYAPTRGGTMNRSVVLTNNAGSTPMISLTSGNNHHVGVVGIRFNDGSGTGNYLRLSGTGSKVPLVADCSFEFELRNGNNPNERNYCSTE